MSVSLLKRYRNEVNSILARTKKCISPEWGDDFYIIFTIKSPYAGYAYESQTGTCVFSMNLRVNRIFRDTGLKNKIKAIEDNGLVYIGVDLDKSFVNSIINSYVEDTNAKDIDSFVARSFIKEVIWDREKDKFNEYSSKNNETLTGYSGPLLLGNIETYADYGLMAKKVDGGIEFVSPGWKTQFLYDFLSNNLDMIKNLNYFKVCRKEVEDLFSNLSVEVADKEFPKLSNRKFLPIVTVNLDKDEVSYLFKDRYIYRNVSFPAYNKGIMKLSIEYFIKEGGSNIIPPTNVLEMQYKEGKCRCNDGSRLPINLSVN